MKIKLTQKLKINNNKITHNPFWHLHYNPLKPKYANKRKKEYTNDEFMLFKSVDTMQATTHSQSKSSFISAGMKKSKV